MWTGGMIWSGGAISRGTCSMQSTGQKGTQASQPVQPSTTTANSFGRFFFLVYFSGILGMSPRKSFSFRSLKTAMNPPAISHYTESGRTRPLRQDLQARVPPPEIASHRDDGEEVSDEDGRPGQRAEK